MACKAAWSLGHNMQYLSASDMTTKCSKNIPLLVILKHLYSFKQQWHNDTAVYSCQFSASTLLVGWQEGHPACKNFCFKIPCEPVNVTGWDISQSTLWATQLPGTKVFICPVRVLRIKMTGDGESRRQLANPSLPEKNWPLKQYVCLCVNVMTLN